MTTEKMTNAEINRYIHEKVMGKCVHDRNYLGHVKYGTDEPTSIHDLQAHGKYACHKCPDVSFNGGNDDGRCPDYCSDDSRRSLLNEVEETVVELVDAAYEKALWRECWEPARKHMFGERTNLRPIEIGSVNDLATRLQVFAKANQRARACVAAHQSADTALPQQKS